MSQSCGFSRGQTSVSQEGSFGRAGIVAVPGLCAGRAQKLFLDHKAPLKQGRSVCSWTPTPAGTLGHFSRFPAGERLLFFCSSPPVIAAYFSTLSRDAAELISLDFLPPIINLLQY